MRPAQRDSLLRQALRHVGPALVLREDPLRVFMRCERLYLGGSYCDSTATASAAAMGCASLQPASYVVTPAANLPPSFSDRGVMIRLEVAEDVAASYCTALREGLTERALELGMLMKAVLRAIVDRISAVRAASKSAEALHTSQHPADELAAFACAGTDEGMEVTEMEAWGAAAPNATEAQSCASTLEACVAVERHATAAPHRQEKTKDRLSDQAATRGVVTNVAALAATAESFKGAVRALFAYMEPANAVSERFALPDEVLELHADEAEGWAALRASRPLAARLTIGWVCASLLTVQVIAP